MHIQKHFKFDNLEEMEQFSENHTLPKLSWDEINCLNSPITILKKSNFVTRKLQKKISRPIYAFARERTQTFKEIKPDLHNLFQKTEVGEHFPNHFMKAESPNTTTKQRRY